MMDKRAVVLYDGDERFLPRSASFRPWPRCHLGLAGAQSMISFNEKEITANVSPHKLFVNDLECSPTMWDIMKGYFLPAIYPTSLRENTRNFVYPMLMSAMKNR